MLQSFVAALPKAALSAGIALVLVTALNLALGASWAEVQGGLLGDVGFFAVLALLFAAYDAWRAQRRRDDRAV